MQNMDPKAHAHIPTLVRMPAKTKAGSLLSQTVRKPEAEDLLLDTTRLGGGFNLLISARVLIHFCVSMCIYLCLRVSSVATL